MNQSRVEAEKQRIQRAAKKEITKSEKANQKPKQANVLKNEKLEHWRYLTGKFWGNLEMKQDLYHNWDSEFA